MKKTKLLLFGCVGLLLAVLMGWWCYEQRFTPDERLERARDRDVRAAIYWWSLNNVIPRNWADRPILAGWDYLLARAREKEALLVERGYYTNCDFVITNLPDGINDSMLLSAEIDRRIQAYLPERSNAWRSMSISAGKVDGRIGFTCRTGQMEDFLHAMQKALPPHTNTPAD